ncbi:Undecaprenyl-diphosphatase [bioreactor metagenome]|uniref:Undecaprenyl-diphosphatase n=1 Tax=bioreactor metagenome TaxID=1076179 RepID=A0A645AC15_9ZZZZ|nr:undecaprenyl-diphosphate phosphatase [Rikenellaceae bacterium]
MSTLEAIVLGLVQGLTEFLPVSSSGHLVIGKELLGIDSSGVAFEVVVHAATVLSTLVAFRKDILELLSGVLKFKMNGQTIYVFKILISMVPVFIVGMFLKDHVEALFGDGTIVVGIALLVTSFLLYLSGVLKPKEKGITFRNALIIGVAQSVAVIPGLSRSGATISTGLLLGARREDIAKFSFLMVLVPILGEAFLELVSGGFASESTGIGVLPLAAGFLAAFTSGLFACKAMIALVKKTKLKGFALYCAILGVIAIIYSYV